MMLFEDFARFSVSVDLTISPFEFSIFFGFSAFSSFSAYSCTFLYVCTFFEWVCVCLRACRRSSRNFAKWANECVSETWVSLSLPRSPLFYLFLVFTLYPSLSSLSLSLSFSPRLGRAACLSSLLAPCCSVLLSRMCMCIRRSFKV